MRIAPVQSYLRVGFWADTQTRIGSRSPVEAGRLEPNSFRPGHVVVRQDRVLWSFRVVHLHLTDGDRLGGSVETAVAPPEPIDREWPSDALPEIEEPELQAEPCDCQPEVLWMDGGLFNVLV